MSNNGMRVETITDMQRIKQFAQNEELYICNNTNIANNGRRGIFHMSIVDESGMDIAITIPNTWIPINASNFCDPMLFTKSSNFRVCISKGNLVVIDPKRAKEILSTESAKTEYAKLFSSTNTNSNTIEIENAPTIKPEEVINNEEEQKTEQLKEADHVFNALVNKFKSSEISEKQFFDDWISYGVKPGDETLQKASSMKLSVNIMRYIGMVLSSDTLPPLEEVFDDVSSIENISFR